MKKLLPTLVALFATTFSAQAAAPIATPGQVSAVTIALTTTYQTGGFTLSKSPKALIKGSNSYYNTVTDTATAYKQLYSSVIKTGKYTNKEFIADLITKGTLTGSASDWKLNYVTNNDFSGIFAINKDGTTVVYLGGYTSNGPAISINQNVSAYNENGTDTQTRLNYVTQQETRKSSYTGLDTVSIVLTPLSGETISTTALSTSSGTYTQTQDRVKETSSSSSTQDTTTFSNIIGDDNGYSDYGVIFTGIITIGTLNNVKDVSVYVTAYNNYNN